MSMGHIYIIQGNITKIETNVVVNVVNNTLLEEYRKLKDCETGKAKITKGYKLPAKYVIYTVAPIWREGDHDEGQLLAACYCNSLQLAVGNGIKQLHFRQLVHVHTVSPQSMPQGLPC